MELFQLRSFLKVAEESSVTRAADALFLTQPAVTQHIQALERELGVPLFDRTGRGVQLTAAGTALREHARQSLAILDETRSVIADLELGKSGRLVLGAGVTTSIFQLPKWLGRYRERSPGVDVVVRTGRSREVVAFTLNREIDLGLVTSPVEHPDINVTGLYDEEIVLVAPGWSSHSRTEIALDQLGNEPMILFPKGSGFRDYLDSALATAGILTNVKMETDSVEAIKSFVAVGLGLSFLPFTAVRAEMEAGSLTRVQVPDLSALVRTTYLIHRKGRYLSRTAKDFVAVLTDNPPVP